ncbi:Eyes absent-like protein [Thalictrum thalictroides]|uniref:protein-tyrosine-phosphatase n=1 Tax=Thalictrum thalictroides TaxID=46969 RepID=A0A7J6WG58_THATH|nr:Eyes absent-like protein [Thalictrum thalictroides]
MLLQGLQNILDQGLIKSTDDLYDLTDNYTDRWLSSARAFLEQSSGRTRGLNSHLYSSDKADDLTDTTPQDINILVTSGSLIPSLVKCMLFRLDDLIMHQNVYSSWEVGKLQCFSYVKERFSGPNVQFCVIGDGWEECEAAHTMRWPFVQVDFQPGSFHRFPGLTLKTVSHYIAVVYEVSDAESDKH